MTTAGRRSLLASWIGGASARLGGGRRSMLASWIGGASAVRKAGRRSFLAPWIGGASGAGIVLGSEILPGLSSSNQFQYKVAVNPTDATNWIIALKNGTGSTKIDAIYSTRNSGSTWSAVSIAPAAGAVDPYVVFDASGVAHYTYIDYSSSPAHLTAYRRSTDKGVTWSTAVYIDSIALDHPCACVDMTSGTYAGSIYVAGVNFNQNGNIYVVRSRDGGTTWTTATVNVTAYTKGSGLASGFVGGPIVCSDGTLVIPVTSGELILSSGGNYTGQHQELYLLRSTDGGVTFSVIDVGSNNYPVEAWSECLLQIPPNLVIATIGGVETLIYGMIEGAASTTPPLRIYKSTNKGSTWSGPTTVIPASSSGDGPANGVSFGVNAAGVIGLMYYGINQGATTYNVYFTYSKDGTATWAPSVLINTIQSKFLPPLPVGNIPRPPGQDQTYMDVGADGKFTIAWSGTRTSSDTVYTTSVRQVTVN